MVLGGNVEGPEARTAAVRVCETARGVAFRFVSFRFVWEGGNGQMTLVQVCISKLEESVFDLYSYL